MQHTVIGNGTAPTPVLIEGLKDVLDEGDSLGLIWTGKPTEGQEVVYDYVLDNELPFVLYYEDGQNPPRVFRESDEGMTQKSRDPLGKALADTTGNILFLWEDESSDVIMQDVWDNMPDGTNILELTNGLTPIVLEDEASEVTEAREEREVEREVEPEEDDTDDDDTRFTKDELEVMNAAAVKRYGARLNLHSATKSGIISELFPETSDPEDDDGGMLPQEIVTPLGQVVPEAVELARNAEDDVEAVVETIRDFLLKVVGGYYN